MGLTKVELEKRKKLAKDFMAAMARVELSHDDNPDCTELNKIENELRQLGWLKPVNGPRKGCFAIRYKVHGGPLMLNCYSGEPIFQNFHFAQLCLNAYADAYKSLVKTTDCEIVQIKS